MNLTTNPQMVYKNAVVGTTSAVAHVVENQNEMDTPEFGIGRIGVFPEHLKQLYAEAIEDFNLDEAEKTKKILLHFKDLFSKSKDDFGRTPVTKHRTNTDNAGPTKQPPRRLHYHAADFVDQEVENMMEKGIVEPSSSPWAAGVVLVEKKDSTKRVLRRL
jgi:hypothetical protein